MSEGAEKTIELSQITDEIRQETKVERRERLVREFIETAYEGGVAGPEEILPLIETELVDNAIQYPSLLNVRDGNEERAAVDVRDHMLRCERDGRSLSIKIAANELEQAAAAYIHRFPGWRPGTR